MTQDQWNTMTESEKFNYLSGYSPEVEKRHGINGAAKVNDPHENKIVTVYTVSRGEVNTAKASTLYEAAKMDHELIEKLKEQAK